MYEHGLSDIGYLFRPHLPWTSTRNSTVRLSCSYARRQLSLPYLRSPFCMISALLWAWNRCSCTLLYKSLFSSISTLRIAVCIRFLYFFSLSSEIIIWYDMDDQGSSHWAWYSLSIKVCKNNLALRSDGGEAQEFIKSSSHLQHWNFSLLVLR